MIPILSLLIFFVMCCLMYVSVMLGYRLGRWQIKTHPLHKLGLLGVAEGAVFALFGLLLAFTFTGAYERFEHRKLQIIEEANTIHSAYLMLDLLKPEFKPVIRETFKEYLRTRMGIFQDATIIHYSHIRDSMLHARDLQEKIWNQSIAALNQSHNPAADNALPNALIAMIDAADTQLALSYLHPPLPIMFLLFALALLSGFLTGYNMARKKLINFVHLFTYVAITTITLYLVFELEVPRFGLIRVTPYDHQIEEVNKQLL